MAYSKTEWINGASPAINSTNLNKIEEGIYTLDATVTTHTSSISNLASTVGAHTTSIEELTTSVDTLIEDTALMGTDIETLQDEMLALDSLVIIRQGTFTGAWTPTFTSTFNVATHANYNWVCYLNVPSYTVQNGEVLQKTVTFNGDNITFSSLRGSTGVYTEYTLIGYLKANSNYAIVDEV